ncbi:MAG: hypothetical protein ACRD68_12545, partial [Pyrinomonadaceae bacterium]
IFMTVDQRNWLERLGERIPGYSGYAQRERRRDIDKLHREHLADRLRGVKTPVNEAIREMTSTGRLMEIGPLDRVLKKLDQIENRVRFASYGYSGFFDVAKVEEPQLEAIYRFDLALVERVEALDVQARSLGGGDAKATAGELERAVDELNRTFDERHTAVNDFGRGGSPEGQPMFGA